MLNTRSKFQWSTKVMTMIEVYSDYDRCACNLQGWDTRGTKEVNQGDTRRLEGRSCSGEDQRKGRGARKMEVRRRKNEGKENEKTA